MKHTPGPWSVYEDVSQVAAHGAKYPRQGTVGKYDSESITDQQGNFCNPADAILCSAAPDMLEALQWAVDNPEDSAYWLGRAIDALAKAKGMSPD